MQRAIIFANGWMNLPTGFLKDRPGSDFIIAADGGAHHCIANGITPNVVIGDFDSLEPDTLIAFQKAGVELIKFSTRKDETDLELALQLTLDRGFDDVYIIAALGDRWDMSIANILLLANPAFSKLNLHLLDGSMEFFLVRGGSQVKIHNKVGIRLSLIPLAGDAYGITTQGLEYPLLHETLFFGSSRGISNVFTQEAADIKISEGLLLCICEKAEM